MSWCRLAVRTENHGLQPQAALDKPISVLLSVSPTVAAALADIDVLTVFDLAIPTWLGNAAEICRLAEGRQARLADIGRGTPRPAPQGPRNSAGEGRRPVLHGPSSRDRAAIFRLVGLGEISVAIV